jgi:hypothetical protein
MKGKSLERLGVLCNLEISLGMKCGDCKIMKDKNDFFLTILSCSASILASGIFLFYFISCNALREKVSMRLIAIFQLFDMILSINTLIPFYLFPRKRQEDICALLGFNEQFFSTCELIWMFWFSLYVYRKICLGKDQNEAINITKTIIFTLLLSFIIAIFFAFLGLYHASTYWCWINMGKGQLRFFLVGFLGSYVFMFISCGWGVIVTLKVYFIYLKNSRIVDWNIFRLQIYPIIMFFAYIFMFITRVREASDKEVPEAFAEFSSCLINSIGLINFIVLGFTREFKTALKFKVGQETPLVI